MKLELDSGEVEQFLTGYATHTLHIPVNRMRLNIEGSVTLWWEAPPPAPRPSGFWARAGRAIASLWWTPYNYLWGKS